jgi:ech hydrogenase subunit E
MKTTLIPFGPQHPVLPEPLSFDLVLDNERVLEAIPSIGFIHRGLELLAPKRDFEEFVMVAERICGICSFMHGMGYCSAVEGVLALPLPKRALQLRLILAELSRVHSHLLWLGLAADAFGFENLFMQTWRLREVVLDIFEETTGGRVIFNIVKVGGMRKDIDDETLSRISAKLESIKPQLKEITDIFLNDYTVRHRLSGLAVLSAAQARELCVVGPMLRASGVADDQRTKGGAYSGVEWEVVTEPDGDCHARCRVRVREIFQSINMVSQTVRKMAADGIAVKVTAAPNGEAFFVAEQPRGEAVYYVRGNGTRFLERFRVRTPTFANVPAVIKLLKGVELADVPTIILTIDPCISCMER